MSQSINTKNTNGAAEVTSMPSSLVALTSNLIDYAGLFPPAKLDMSDNVSNYSKYLSCNESWMLGRLIIPAARLEWKRGACNLGSVRGRAGV